MRLLRLSAANVALALLTVLATPLATQQATETPEQVAARYLHALSAQQWDSMAFLMHPYALHQLRDVLAPLFEAPSLDGAREELLGVRSISAAKALSDTAVFTAFIARGLGSQSQLMDFLRKAKIQLIGHVPEGRDTVHIVYRMTFEDSTAAISKMDVFSMLRMGNTWRGLLSADFRMLGAMLRRQART